ncbi:MAG: hypothetical protein IJV05_06195 [Muribaculaceae bacterium]|nr:hypothetical protein [Muribaculaceae bacterium]
MMRRATILLLAGFLLATAAASGQSRSHYNSARNNFGGLYPHPGMRMAGRYKAIEEERLVEENASMATAISLDTTHVGSAAYRYQLRLANLNNKQGKSISVKNPMTGGKTQLTSTQWGLVFNRDELGNYCAVVLSCDNSAPLDDIMDVRSMLVSLIQNIDGTVNTLATTTVTHGVSLEDGLNTISVDVGPSSVRVSLGKSELSQLLEAQVTRPAGPVQVGYLVGPGASVSIDRAVLTIDGSGQAAVTPSTWTRQSLDQHLAQSTDPLEGYWNYLDRDMQDDWLRLGGRYTLATVRTADGYDLIYIDGAQVMKSQWQTGMVKGHISRTIFGGNYDLTWTDATMEPIGGQDAYATIEGGSILTLYFPVYKSQVRFSRVIRD